MRDGRAVRGRGGRKGPAGRGLVAVLLGLTLLATGCGEDEANGGGEKPGKAAEVADGPSRATVDIAPRHGAEDVATTGALKVTARGGALTDVTVESSEGEAVEGSIGEDGASWKPKRALATGTEYHVNAVARDAEGRTAAKTATFTTVVARDTFIGYFTPEDGSTVGVGMPVSLRFSRPVEDRDAVAGGVEVTADPAVEVRGHWFGNQRLDFRPEDYWEPGTEVTLSLRLGGVEAADGVYGTQNKDVTFTVGRSMVSTVDAKKKTMTVERDGEVWKTLPITAGSPQTPTWNGQMVISEKHEVTRMNGDTVGFGGEYDIKDVPHAMRLSTSGTFVHGNYWAGRSTFGARNVSHGCVGLFDQRGGGDPAADAAWFYDHSMIGDVVVVKNSQDKTIAPDNGLNGWNLDWSEWGR
ncbi:L,D-transpeptidase family protein [Streptomyces chumphonensis]|uniref:L,D-transpeptidase family protein n=1 Tax=Streptomyces chumphonensis TaxID=1214925 RepID=A0A927F1Z5_9ACTN|nr:L,D-transpeptidase family protein [Streptomyces chumphonensis]